MIRGQKRKYSDSAIDCRMANVVYPHPSYIQNFILLSLFYLHVSVLHAKGLTDIAIIDVFFSLFFYPPIRNSRLRMQTELY